MNDKKIKTMENILNMLSSIERIKWYYNNIDIDIRKDFNSYFKDNTIEQAISHLQDTLKKHLEFCVKE